RGGLPAGRRVTGDGLAGREVLGEPHEAQVPADAGRARAVLVPEGPVLGDPRGVLQLEPRPGPVGTEAHRDPARVAAELPGRRERARRLARLDRAAGVALDLVLTTLHEVAVDRREPAGQ